MTIDEQIAVIFHYRDGGEVETTEKGEDKWRLTNEPRWNFDTMDYRIKEKPKTKTVWFWKVKSNGDLWYIRNYMCTEEEIKKEWGDALEFKRMDILGSEEVPND